MLHQIPQSVFNLGVDLWRTCGTPEGAAGACVSLIAISLAELVLAGVRIIVTSHTLRRTYYPRRTERLPGRPIMPTTEEMQVAAETDTTVRAYDVEGCGPDQRITSCDAESAAHEIAQWQYGDDGAHTVTLEWIGTGSDGASVAEYRVTVDGIEMSRRIVVRTVSA